MAQKYTGNVVSNLCFYNFLYQNFGKSPRLGLFLHNTLSKLDKILERIYALF